MEKSKKKTLCVCHKVLAAKGNITPFTSTSWKRFQEAAPIWNDHIYTKCYEHLKSDIPYGGYHRQCYQRYTNRDHLQRLKDRRTSPRKRCQQPQTSNDPSPRKRVRRSDVPGIKEKERICFVCRKTRKIKRDKKNYEIAIPCEHDDVEKKIKSAARIRKDKRVLLDVEGKDLKAIEYSYHRTCYGNYTNNKNLTRIEREKEEKTSNTFQAAFDKVCDTIDDTVLIKKKAVSIHFLREEYKSLFDEEDTLMSCHTHKLKKRIISTYGEKVTFVRPDVNQCEYIYSSELKIDDVVASLLEQSQDSDDPISEKETHVLQDDDNITNVCHCGILIHKTVKGFKQTLPWPPSPEDVAKEKIKVPDLLYNLLAYIITGIPSPVSEGKVEVKVDTDRSITALAQDIITIIRKGHVKTVKSLGLGIAVRNLTGNKEVITLLNKFGHTLSYDAILDYEKLLVRKLHDDQMNTLIIPSSARKRVFSTWIWDNTDLCEETLSGAGTTHVTNGILVQQGPSAARIELSADLNYQPPAEPMENTILPFVLPPGKKGPKPLQVDVVVILAKSLELLMETAKEDFLWTVVRQQPVVGLFTVDDRAAQVIPSWTGYNASIRDTVPTPNTIGFLQPVNESPTEIPAMYTVMKRSQYFARLLELPEVDCVYDQACYAKASHIMWASPDEFGNVVNRLGAFHTIPVFISCIFKMYGDAGLIDVITESGIVASGSLQGVVTGHHYNRAVRTLKTVYEALSRFLWQSFGDNLDKPDVDNPVDIDMNLNQEQVLDIRECLEKDTVEVVLLFESFNKLFTLFIEFKQSKEKGPMFLFWGNFLRMVELLLAFIRAAREGNWELHLAAFREMLPLFFTLTTTIMPGMGHITSAP